MHSKAALTLTILAVVSSATTGATTSGAMARPIASAPSATKAVGNQPQRKTFGLPEPMLELMLRNHKCKEATELLQHTKREPGDDDARKIYQACILSSADEVEQACAVLEQVHSFDDAAAPTLVYVGKTYASNNQYEKALKMSTIAYSRDHSITAGDLRAAVLMQLKKYKEACEQYQSDAKNNPSCARGALCKAGSVQLYNLHNPAAALKLVQQARNASKAQPDTLLFYSEGECFRALNEPKKALASYSAGIDLERAHGRQRNIEAKAAYCNLYKARSAVYKQLGMIKEAAFDTREYDKISNEAADYLMR